MQVRTVVLSEFQIVHKSKESQTSIASVLNCKLMCRPQPNEDRSFGTFPSVLDTKSASMP